MQKLLQFLLSLNRLAKLHLIVGTLFLLWFLGTGVYLITQFPEAYGGREEVRMMFRASHIYILLASLINISVGCSMLFAPQRKSLLISVSSGLLVLAPVLLGVAFIVEPPIFNLDRPITFWAIVSLLAGTLLHALVLLTRLKQSNNSQ